MSLPAELQHPVGHQRARAAATDGGDPFRGFRHGGRRRPRLHLETGIDDGASQVGRDLLVGARFHDERDVRVIPVPDQRAGLAPDREAGQEDQEDCQQHGQRVATQDRLEGGTRATLLLGREGEGEAADHGRQDQRADEHPETHDALRHDVLRRDQEQQEGADLRHEHARDEHHPDDRAERHAEQQDLARRRHAAEQQGAGPAERGRQDLGRESGAQGDEGGEDGHGRRVGPRA